MRNLRGAPTIFIIDGVTITVNFDEHPPPHFHARIAEHRAAYLLDGTPMNGSLPAAKDKVVREWAKSHSSELTAAWNDAGSVLQGGVSEHR